MSIPKEIYVNPDMPGRYFEGIPFAADRKYILSIEHTALLERHRRLIEAVREWMVRLDNTDTDGEHSCFSECVLAHECDKDIGTECLWVARVRAALGEEG